MAEIKTYIINDKWTDLDAENNVAVMSVDGEIDKVYVNGTEAGGGGGDFSTAEVTIHFTFSETSDDMTNVNAFVPVCLTDAEISAFPSIPMNDIPSGSTSADVIINVPLFKNKTTMGITYFSFKDEYGNYYFDYDGTPTATGNATIDNEIVTITGNSTLNIPVAMIY